MDIFEYSRLSKEEIAKRIDKAKCNLGAVIIAHSYQRIEVQQIADIVGDSLELTREVVNTDAPIIVFCGVMFMAETAKIINPDKVVLIPEIQAGCPLAAHATAEDVIRMKGKYPGYKVVTYINSTAEVKSVSDIVCTSANSVKVVESFPKEQGIIFVPDKNLCAYTKRITGRENIVCWDGHCYVHDRITAQDVLNARKMHPDAVIIAHPEVNSEVQELSDLIGSTSVMYRYVRDHPKQAVVLVTEYGLIQRINVEFPGTPVYPIYEHAICSNMKLITLEKVLRTLDEQIYEINIPNAIANRAGVAIDRMLAIK